MKKINKSSEPQILQRAKNEDPYMIWEDFKSYANPNYVKDFLEIIFNDQGQICAYCEAEVDFLAEKHKVEHFHPKSDGIQWHLDWQNLLGCCKGGETIADKKQRQQNLSCDTIKDNKILDEIILNPLTIPLSPAIFTLDEATGDLKPNNNIDIETSKIQKTIDELNLNCHRLKEERKIIIDQYNQTFGYEVADEFIFEGDFYQQNKERIAAQWLDEGTISFFTTKRILLGPEYEDSFKARI